MCVCVLQEKQAAEAGQQAPGGAAAAGAAGAEGEARLQEQLQELTAKIAELDDGEGLCGAACLLVGSRVGSHQAECILW
jgi:hypothetical protein